MKKLFLVVTVAVLLVCGHTVQGQGQVTLNTRAWTTNYWTTLIYSAAESAVEVFLGPEGTTDSLILACILPGADLVFPVGIEKAGFGEGNDIYGPYHRAFSNPFKRLGDYAIGLDFSWTPTVVGFYAGAFFKSQEICFTADDANLRAFYFQPRGGLILRGKNGTLEGGVFYDKVVGAGGTFSTPEKSMFKDGLGLEFGFSYSLSDHSKSSLLFMMPLHNFLNEGYSSETLNLGGLHRRVGYIMLSHRVIL